LPATDASVFVHQPSSYMRNQDNIRQFVDNVRVARQSSERRKMEAEIQRQAMLNHQAALDAAVYIYERQRRQQDMASARPSPQQAQKQVRVQEPQRDVDSFGSSSSVEVLGCGTRALATVLPMRRHKDRRRQSEGPLRGEAPVRDSQGRRRATVFGVFCGDSDSVSTLAFDGVDSRQAAAHVPPPVPSKAARATARVIKRKAKKAPASAYVNKDLPPLPQPGFRSAAGVPVSGAGIQQDKSEYANGQVTKPALVPKSEPEPELEPAPEPETFSIPVIDGTRSPMHRSRSFSHFGSNPRIEFPEKRRTRDNIPDPWRNHAETAAFVQQLHGSGSDFAGPGAIPLYAPRMPAFASSKGGA
ncbi:hypothetical protein LPJ56_006860, partial [Coemansia sp. RSA 2599]